MEKVVLGNPAAAEEPSKDVDSKYSNQCELTIGVEWINRKSPMIVWVGMVAVIHQYGVPLVQGVTIR